MRADGAMMPAFPGSSWWNECTSGPPLRDTNVEYNMEEAWVADDAYHGGVICGVDRKITTFGGYGCGHGTIGRIVLIRRSSWWIRDERIRGVRGSYKTDHDRSGGRCSDTFLLTSRRTQSSRRYRWLCPRVEVFPDGAHGEHMCGTRYPVLDWELSSRGV